MKDNLKVLHINNFKVKGGAETVFNLTRENIKGVANFSGFIPQEVDNEAPDLKFHSWENNRGIFRTINYIYSRQNYKILLSFLEKNDIDIIHLHAFLSPLSLSILSAIKKIKKKKKLKVIETLHGFHYVCPNLSLYNYRSNSLCEKCIGKPLKYHIFIDNCDGRGYHFSTIKGLKTFIERTIINHSAVIDKFISPSEFLRNKFIQDGIPADKITLVRNPMTIRACDEDIKKENIICYFGRFSREKNLEFLLSAFLEWKRRMNNNFRLLFIGDGIEKEKLLAAIRNNPYETSIIMKDFMPKETLIKEIKCTKYFAMSSKCYENAPMTIIEAFLLNIIPIVPNIGGMEESVKKIVNLDTIYQANNIDSFIETISRIEDNYNFTYSQLKSRKENLLKELELNKYCENILDIYKSVNDEN